MDLRVSYNDNPIMAELYDLVPAYRDRPDKDFYLKCAAAAKGRILELGCGTGRILAPIAEAGYPVTGLDMSEHMLAKCRRKLEALGKDRTEQVQLVRGNMADFQFDGKFGLTIITFHAFQHLITMEQQMACLGCINRHLELNGRLIFDVFFVDFKRINNPLFLEEMEMYGKTVLPDGHRLKANSRIAGFHPAEQYNDIEMIYYLTNRDGRSQRVVHAFPMRYFFRYEVEHLLERCGFRVAGLYGKFDESPLADDSPEMIFVAEKYRE
ncbi:Type 12 methyltransferase [Candidatus Zixiibacteriota bacterium]|nr:Type 12 methyltransferase [candidate division Zixibacteria bacterium]